jgi:hypothetical protein
MKFRASLAFASMALVACKGESPSTPPVPAASAAPTLSASAAPSPAITTRTAAAAPAFALLRERLLAEWLALDPAFGRSVGLHEYDGLVADYSRVALDKQATSFAMALSELDATDAKALNEEDALDLAILKHEATLFRFSLVERDATRKSPRFYEDIFDVESYVDRDYAPAASRLSKLVAHEESALAQAANVRKNLVLPIPTAVAHVAVKIYAGFATYLRSDVTRVFDKIGDAALHTRFVKANDALAKEAESLAKWLEKEVEPTGDESFRLGADRFRKFLFAQEGLTIPIEELRAMAEADLAKNKAAYDVLSKTTKLTPIAADKELAAATRIVADARKFLVDHAILTLASDDDAQVVETPVFRRWNAAALDISGPLDPFRVAHYEITPPDPSWPKAEQTSYVLPLGTLVATSVHEVYPGHFVQGRWVNRAPSRVQQIFSSYSFSEGWAHYGEQLMVEEGFYADQPEIKLGQVIDALLRDCRFVGSIALHVDGKSVDEVAKRFVDDCHQDAATAREQAIRGTFDPGYFAYTLGKIQILNLREEAKTKLGTSFSLKRFHDALLSHGTSPVTLIRERVLRQLGAGG